MNVNKMISPMVLLLIGNREIFKSLLDRGAAKRNKIEQSPIMYACVYGHTEIVRILIDRGVDFNKCDSCGESPVMKAFVHGRTEIVQLLLNKGANCNK